MCGRGYETTHMMLKDVDGAGIEEDPSINNILG